MNPPNYLRQIIITNDLLQYKDYIKTSKRNIDIVTLYANGQSYREIAPIYHVANTRIRQIVSTYVIHCGWCTNRKYFSEYREEQQKVVKE